MFFNDEKFYIWSNEKVKEKLPNLGVNYCKLHLLKLHLFAYQHNSMNIVSSVSNQSQNIFDFVFISLYQDCRVTQCSGHRCPYKILTVLHFHNSFL